MKILKKFFDNFEEIACASLVGIMVFSLTLQVAVRMIFGSSIAWTEELSRYSFIWSVYMGGVLAVKRNEHVRITAQFLLLPRVLRKYIFMLTDGLWVAANFFIAYQSYVALGDALAFPEYSPTLGIVKAYVELIIPVSFVMMNIRILSMYFIHIKNGTLHELTRVEGES